MVVGVYVWSLMILTEHITVSFIIITIIITIIIIDRWSHVKRQQVAFD